MVVTTRRMRHLGSNAHKVSGNDRKEQGGSGTYFLPGVSSTPLLLFPLVEGTTTDCMMTGSNQ